MGQMVSVYGQLHMLLWISLRHHSEVAYNSYKLLFASLFICTSIGKQLVQCTGKRISHKSHQLPYSQGVHMVKGNGYHFHHSLCTTLAITVFNYKTFRIVVWCRMCTCLLLHSSSHLAYLNLANKFHLTLIL